VLITTIQWDVKLQSRSDTSYYVPGNGIPGSDDVVIGTVLRPLSSDSICDGCWVNWVRRVSGQVGQHILISE